MKKIMFCMGLLTVAMVMGLLSCATNPAVGPGLTVVIPELFSPDPDIVDDKLNVSIAVKHPVRIKDWQIVVQPVRQQGSGQGQQGGQAAQRPADARPADARPADARPEGDAAQGQEGQRRQRAPFFEQTGTGTPPRTWQWNGKSTRPSGEMVQSATDYQMTLTVNDVYDNSSSFEGIITVDVLVRREGEDLRIIVPSIIFPPNSSNFALLGEEDMRSNRRVLRLIGNALNRYPAYEVEVEGHSNPTTPPDTTQRAHEEATELKPISEARAQAVVEYLVANQNVERARLHASGIGSARTVAVYDDAEENWKNRRVEFILHR